MEEVAPKRDLDIHYRSISLKVKNESDHDALAFTHNLLRVVEAVRAEEGDAPIQRLYWEMSKRIHHDEVYDFAPVDVLESSGLNPKYADAFDDESLDAVVIGETEAGLALVGTDVGTPIIAITFEDGRVEGIFGPVMTPIPRGQDALTLWDSILGAMSVSGFYELKRTRTVGPDAGPQP